jgi:CheY-like chemotaxis protein
MNLRIKGKRILWVDDHFEDLREELQALEKSGATATCVHTANAAYERLVKESYDIVIIDLLLPQQETLHEELRKFRDEAGLGSRTELHGVVLALWLTKTAPNTTFFFFTVVVAGSEDVRAKIDPQNRRFVNKSDERTWGEKFPEVVADQI